MSFGKKKDQERQKNSYYYYYYDDKNSKSAAGFKVMEAYKTLRTNLVFSVLHPGCKSFVISSATPGEGKSTVSTNTAISFSQTDARVLLIDCDLRKPKVHRFLNMNNVPGLTNLISGVATLDAVVRPTSYPNLDVITAGAMVPNPSEVLASERVQELLEQMKQKYDYIIIDTPPLLVVSDAVPLIKATDGVVLVAFEGRSTFNEVERVIQNMKMLNCTILGMVLNGVGFAKKANYGYYYYRRRRSSSYYYDSYYYYGGSRRSSKGEPEKPSENP